MKHILTFFSLGLLTFSTLFGQSCLLVELPLQQRVQQSTLIVEGEVVQSAPFANSQGTLINTAHTIKIHQLFKGQLGGATHINVITQGGQLGQQMQVVQPAVTLRQGDKGLFLLVPAQYDGQPIQLAGFEAFGGPQGYIAYTADGRAVAPFETYPNISASLIAQVVQWTQQSPQVITTASQPQQLPTAQRGAVPAITSFSPTTVTAGTFSEVVISGNGFGTLTGQAEVAFPNANDGGATYNPVPASQVLSWTNTQIRLRVPTDAGTGTIRVTDAAGQQTFSANPITIPYSVLNLDVNGNFFRSYLKDINASGGLTFQFNSNFQNYPAATAAVQRALESWRCASFVNFDLATAPTNAACQNQEGISVINWDTACALPAGVLGQTRSNYSFCTSPITIYLDDVDIIFTKQPTASLSWNFGPGATTNQQFDFESVVLHELGHAHQLTHVIAPTEVMHYAIGPGSDQRILSVQDVDGGEDVVNFSNANTCGPAAHAPLNAGNCGLGGLAVAFVGVPQQGCAPHEVFFFDQTPGNPISWRWDVDNDGVIDYNAKNISHTYTQSGSYDVMLIVESANGFDTLLQKGYINVDPPLIANAGQDTILCAGNTLQLQGSATGGDTDYNVQWSPAAGLSNTTIFNPLANPSVTTSYVLSVSDGNGCTDTDTITISLVNGPTADAGRDVEVCIGQPAKMGGQPAASGGVGPYTYKWLPDGLGISDSANPIFVPKVTDTYTLLVTDAQGCTSTDDITITVLPLPTANAGSDFTLCSGGDTILGGNPAASGGAGGYTYLWLPNQLISSTADPNPRFTSKGSGQVSYILTIFDAKGCVDRDTVVANILPGVSVRAGFADPVCAGGEVAIGGNPTGSGGTGTLNYSWSPITGLNDPTATNPVAQPSASTMYTIDVVDRNGCAGRDSVLVTVLPSPTADAGTDKGLCDGLTGSTVIGGNPSGTGGLGQLIYAWSPSFGLSDSTLPNPTAAPGMATTYILTVKDGNDCEDTDTMRVTINPRLVARAGTRDSVCANACTQLGSTPAAVGGDGNFTYAWEPVNGVDDPTLANPIACPASTTTYTLSVIDGKGCTSTDTIRVVTKAAPTADFGSLDTAYCLQDRAVTLTGVPTGGAYAGSGITGTTFDPGAAGLGTHVLTYEVINSEGCATIDSVVTTVYDNPPVPTIFVRNDTLFTQQGFSGYQWLFNGISIANANDYFLYRPAGQIKGNYEVIVTNANDCSSRSASFTYTYSGPTWDNATVSVVPNPATTQAEVKISLAKSERITLTVYTMQGAVVANFAGTVATQQAWQLSTQSWASGLYVIQVQGENGRLQVPLVVQ